MTAQKTFNKYLMGTISAMALLCMSAPAFASEADILKKLEALQATITAQSQELSQLRTDNEKLHQEVAATKEKADKTAVKADKAADAIQKAKTDKTAALDMDAASYTAIKPAAGGSGKVSSSVLDALDGAILDHERNSHSSKLKVSGWSAVEYRDTTKRNDNPVIDPRFVYLDFDAKLDSNWRFFGELEYEHMPAVEGGPVPAASGNIFVDRAYIEYNHSDLLNARAGRVFTPVGIWLPTHWTINVPSMVEPIFHLNQYVSDVSIAGEAFGTYNGKDGTTFKYMAWTSMADQASGSNAAVHSAFATGLTGTVILADKYMMGLSGYTAQDAVTANMHNRVLQPFFQFDLPHGVQLSGEYQHFNRTNGGADLIDWYTSLKWQFHPKAYAYYRYDKGNDEAEGLGGKQQMNVFTLGYWPIPAVRLKAEFATHRFDDPAAADYNVWGTQLGIIF